MAALSRLIAKELSSALGITDNPKFNPMFKQTDEALEDVSNPATSTIAEFYSPLESAIENAPIGKQGTRGENIEAFVRKRAPKVTQAELDYREFSLDPARNYTRGDSSGAIDDGMEPLNIKAVKKKTANQNMQRQGGLLDPEVGYEEIGVDIIGADLGLMTHYGPNNLAHARYSLRKTAPTDEKKNELSEFFSTENPRRLASLASKFDSSVGKKYILIEELQSDVIQNMTDDPAKVMRESIARFKREFDSDIDKFEFEREFELSGSLFNDFDDFVFNELIPIGVNKKLTSNSRTPIIRELFEKRGYKSEGVYLSSAVGDMFKSMMYDRLGIYEFPQMDQILGKMNQDFKSAVTEAKVPVTKKEVPINKLTDSVRVLLQSIIADSKAKGIDEIVLPPIEKLAEKRFDRGTSEGLKAYKKAITKGSGFHNTYVVAFEKAIKQLKDELGNQIKIGKKDLKYKTFERIKTYDEIVEEAKTGKKGFPPTTVQGTSINIKDLKLDPTKIKLRLNKGGLVQRPNR